MIKPTQVSSSDLALFQKARIGLEQSQVVMNFVSTHLAQTYGLMESDTFDLRTGEIVRAESRVDHALGEDDHASK